MHHDAPPASSRRGQRSVPSNLRILEREARIAAGLRPKHMTAIYKNARGDRIVLHPTKGWRRL